ncbi:AAA family ATPase [Raineyella fluvialis]|uniref:AAA family ATPase n=1 Tax=Raineyella fluvialis TaxID=2662261 RepID=A0A5Q2FEQ8_9ACTN|nr:AAA family ATPase [Raineyella fluvialis]QGF24297.1 AAA family ATPase [Raineyella fluvialis]
MSRFLVVTNTPDLARNVAYATGAADVATRPATPMPSHCAELLGRDPERPIVVLDARPDSEAALRLTSRCTEAGIVVVLASDVPEQIGFSALKAGATDVVSAFASIPEWRISLSRAESFAGQRALAERGERVGAPAQQTTLGRVITVTSPKGGVGKTTVATNLAVGLARRFAQSTVLVDLDVQYGDVATALGLAPQYTLVDATRGHTATDPLSLKSLLTQHSTGLFVIPGSESPGDAEAVGAREVGVLLHTLAGAFQYVVVDTAPGLSEHTLTALDNSSDLVLVTSLDVPGVRGLRKEMDTLRQVDLMISHHVVLNFTDPHRGITVKDVEANIGEAVSVSLPVAKEVPLSVNQGIPLLQGNGRDQASKQLQFLVDLVVGVEEATSSKHTRRWGSRA